MKLAITGEAVVDSGMSPRFLLNANPGPVLIVGEDGVIEQTNAALEVLTDSSQEQLVGADFSNFFMPREEAERFIRILFHGEAESSTSLVVAGCSGRQIQVHCSAKLFSFPCSGRTKAFVALQDITIFRQSEAQFRYQETRDPLTTLLNRVQLFERLDDSITRSQESSQTVCLILIDLDGFKNINDAFGYEVADEVLKFAAMQMVTVVDDSFAVGRVGGNEFAVVGEGFADVHEVQQLTLRLTTAIGEPFQIDGHEITISCCVGITLYPMDGDDADAILRNATIALHRAKMEGDGHVRYFTAEMNQTIRRRLKIGNCLRHALDKSELLLHFQPRARLADGSITGVEALIRWNSEELGAVTPGEFIPVAEQRGLIVPIGEWVLNSACEQAMQWREQFGINIKMAVNLSGRQLAEVDVVKVVECALIRSGLPSELLELELTESMLMRNTKRMMETLCALKDMGVHLAIDDFGTGYSSLSYLKRFPLDYLKIDRSFVVDIPGSSSDEAIAKTIIAMSHSLGLKVIAEGVETYRQLDFLLGYGCDEVQGFLLAKPMPADDVRAILIRGDLLTDNG
jgi:diguanylate cyclase (GGDEF)-like protein